MQPISAFPKTLKLMSQIRIDDKVIYNCDTCKDTGWAHITRDGVTGVARCECKKKAIRERHLIQLDAMFRGADLETMQAMNTPQAAALEDMRQNPSGNFFLVGENRIGKTHLLAAQFAHLGKQGVKVIFRTAQQLTDELVAHYHPKDEQQIPSTILDTVRHEIPLHLFLDDIDKVGFERTEFRRETLFSLVDSLCAKQMGLSITSNLTYEELQARELIRPATIYRMDEMCRVLTLEKP